MEVNNEVRGSSADLGLESDGADARTLVGRRVPKEVHGVLATGGVANERRPGKGAVFSKKVEEAAELLRVSGKGADTGGAHKTHQRHTHKKKRGILCMCPEVPNP